MTDRVAIYISSALRGLATGFLGVTFALHLHDLQFNASEIGLFISLGLSSGALAVTSVSFWGDRLGRKRTYFLLTTFMILGGIALSLTSTTLWIGVFSFIGMVNGMGRDRGAHSILDQAILPQTISAANRTFAFAWYNLIQDSCLALGALAAGIPALLKTSPLFPYWVIMFFSLLAYKCLSPKVEVARARLNLTMSEETKTKIKKLMALFGLDALSTGFMSTAFLAYFFHQKFGLSTATLGSLFASARVLNAISHPLAAWISKRIGLVNTMVFTHLPSSLILVAAALSRDVYWAVGLFLLRELLVQMDVPTRQSYVVAIVAEHERTATTGLTHIVRMAGWALPPVIGGIVASVTTLAVPIFIGCAIKMTYDVLLYFSFRHVRPPEEPAAS